MNQPSAEELEAFCDACTVKDFQRLLDRYLLFKKSEPIPGAVNKEELERWWANVRKIDALRSSFEKLIETFDIYPKGTVARLTAEIDRLKGVVEFSNEMAKVHLKRLTDKPEAVGCGNEYGEPIAWTFDNQPIYQECGRVSVDSGKTFLCPDCQAKANQPENPDSSKVVLPDVPSLWVRGSNDSYPADLRMVVGQLIECYRAVKAHLEGKDD